METVEYIYEDVVEPSYFWNDCADANRAEHSRKMRVGAVPLNINTYNVASYCKIKRMCVDHPSDRPKPT